MIKYNWKKIRKEYKEGKSVKELSKKYGFNLKYGRTKLKYKKHDEIGRTQKEIDWEHFVKLCKMQCTETEIASFFGCHVDTVNNRCKRKYGMTFSEIYKIKSQGGKISLRRLQWKAAQGGNVAMQIWLGKQYLEQSDKMKNEVTEKNNFANWLKAVKSVNRRKTDK